MRHIKKPDNTGKCYFLLTQDGKPVKSQRTIFSECFYTMAMSELARATGKEKYKVQIMNSLCESCKFVKIFANHAELSTEIT